MCAVTRETVSKTSKTALERYLWSRASIQLVFVDSKTALARTLKVIILYCTLGWSRVHR